MVASVGDPNAKHQDTGPGFGRQKMGPGDHPRRPSRRPLGLLRRDQQVGSSPAAGNFVEHEWRAGTEDDHLSVRAPGSPQKKPVRQLANPDGQAALNRDLLEFPAGCKPDEVTVGRPERVVSSFGTVNRPQLPLIEILDPQLPLRSRAEGDVLAVG